MLSLRSPGCSAHIWSVFHHGSQVFVSLSVLPTIRVWQTEVNATADVGQPAMLTCAVDGYPEPMVTWTR